MTEPTTRMPAPENSGSDPSKSNAQETKTVDPLDLVRTGGYPANPQEAIQSPMVAPEMLNAPGDLRDDMAQDEEDTAF